jgi:hypothetical protein
VTILFLSGLYLSAYPPKWVDNLKYGPRWVIFNNTKYFENKWGWVILKDTKYLKENESCENGQGEDIENRSSEKAY